MVGMQQEKSSRVRSSASVGSLGGRHGAAFWSEERASGSVGVALLERMGWQEGKGLGKKEAGTQSFIRAKLKNDTIGIGASKGAAGDERQNAFAQATTDIFNALLSKLNEAHSTTPGAEDGGGSEKQQEEEAEAEEDTSTVGDAAASIDRYVRKRHLYGRFSRAKDTSLYSSKSKLEIFGRKQAPADAQSIPAQPASSSSKAATAEAGSAVTVPPPSLTTTTSGVSIQSYFASKMAARQQQQQVGAVAADGSASFQTALFDTISQRSQTGRAGLGAGRSNTQANGSDGEEQRRQRPRINTQSRAEEERQPEESTPAAAEQADSGSTELSSDEDRKERKRRRRAKKEAERLARREEEQTEKVEQNGEVEPTTESESTEEKRRRKKQRRERERGSA